MKLTELISIVEGLPAQLEGEAQTLVTELVGKLTGNKTLLIAEFEKELASASPDLQALWAKVKAAL